MALGVQESNVRIHFCQNGFMNPQLSQDYNVDSRYRGMKTAVDNFPAKAFLENFINKRRLEQRGSNTVEKQTEDRILMSGPGSSYSGYRNAFRAKQ